MAGGTGVGGVKRGATVADIADYAGWDSCYESMVGDIMCDDRTGSNHGGTADGVTTDNSTVGAKRGAFFY